MKSKFLNLKEFVLVLLLACLETVIGLVAAMPFAANLQLVYFLVPGLTGLINGIIYVLLIKKCPKVGTQFIIPFVYGLLFLFSGSVYVFMATPHQQYHLDVCYDISDLTTPNEDEVAFTISCPAVEDGSAKIDIVVAEYSIDDGLGEDSVCYIIAKGGAGREIGKAEVRFHNGNGCESEEGIMEATYNSEYDTSELDGFQDDLLAAIESLNPYPEKLNALSYENKGAVQFVADFPCEQCGKFGISIDETFLTIGRCCYCGYENELAKCERCGEMLNVDILEHGLCPSCAAYIDNQ